MAQSAIAGCVLIAAGCNRLADPPGPPLPSGSHELRPRLAGEPHDVILDSAYAYFMREVADQENGGRPPARLTHTHVGHGHQIVTAVQPGRLARPDRVWYLVLAKPRTNIFEGVEVRRAPVDDPDEIANRWSAWSLTKPQVLPNRSLHLWVDNLRDPSPRVREAAWSTVEEYATGRFGDVSALLLDLLLNELATGEDARVAAALQVFALLCPVKRWAAMLDHELALRGEPRHLVAARAALLAPRPSSRPGCPLGREAVGP